MENSSCYTRVLKDYLPQYINQPVTVIGKFKGRMGQKLSLETSENGVVIVENCDLKFETNPTFLEVRGIVKNQNSLNMVEISEIPEDDKEPFGIFLFLNFF